LEIKDAELQLELEKIKRAVRHIADNMKAQGNPVCIDELLQDQIMQESADILIYREDHGKTIGGLQDAPPDQTTGAKLILSNDGETTS
jgi:hypothetical protein